MENVVGFVFVFLNFKAVVLGRCLSFVWGFLWGGTEHMKDIAL